MNVEPAKHMIEEDENSAAQRPIHIPATYRCIGLLCRSLPGQYFAMLLSMQAAFIAVARVMYSPDAVTRFTIMAAAIWAMARVVGVGYGWLVTPIITLASLALTLTVGNADAATAPDWVISGLFSSFMLSLILGVVFVFDILELAETRSQQLARIINRYGLRMLLYGCFGLIAIYALIVPVIQELIFLQQPPPEKPQLAMDRLTLFQNMLFKFVESFSGLIFMVLGTAVGSFMNVIIYRVPLGISVISQRSHCPGCGSGILPGDNLPLVGWLRLNGRCRNCDVKISARYPIVESIIGLTFLLLFFVELISGGTNLPIRSPYRHAGVLWILFYTKWDLVGLYLYHCFLLCTLFTWAMIRRDGYQVPFKTTAFILGITFILPLLLPHLLPWPYRFDDIHNVNYTAQNAAITSVLGLLAGGIVSIMPVIFSWGRQQSRPLPAQFDRPSWLLIGAGLGWQAVLGIFVLLVVWMIGCALIVPSDHTAARNSPKDSASIQEPTMGTELRRMALPCVVLIHHCLWREIAGLFIIH